MRGDITEEDGWFGVEFLQGVVDSRIGIAGAPGDDIGHAGSLFEPRIANRGADRVHIRIAVTNNNCLHRQHLAIKSESIKSAIAG